MKRFKNMFLLGAVLLSALLIIPSLQPVDAADGARPERVAPGLQKQLDEAAPDEMVTAIVKLRSIGPPPQANLGRSAVFGSLRQNARVSQAQLKSFLNRPDIRADVGVTREFWLDNLVLVQARKSVIEQIARRTDVEQVFDNYTVTVPPRPADDPLPDPHQSQPWDNIAYIGVKQVWTSFGLRGAGVRVGGLDTGVDINHPDIAGKMITNNPADPTYPGGWAEFDGNGNVIPGSVPHDSDQHGTHTTGTMVGGNASGWDVGVAPEASLMHGLVIPGGSGSFAQVVGGMEWIIDPDGNPATDDGAQVVNMSLGATGTYTEMVAPTDNMVAAGVFPSFSIGNSGPGASTTGSPGNVPSAFGVGATDNLDVIASFSSRGPVTWNFPPYVGTYTKPDISAPGVSIYSTVPGGEWEYSGWSGTSMAAPHVSGTVALMRQANPSMTVAEIKQILAQTALDLGAAGMDNNYGWGRVNAFAAVSAALVGVGTLDGTVASMGMPVEGALVRVADTGQRVTTDANGDYSIRIVAGDHTIEVSRFGYESASALVTLVADMTTTQDFDLVQLPSGAVAGTVTDSQSGMGVSASIAVKLAGQVVVNASTDPMTGAYSITLPVGTYDLVFTPVFPYPATTRNGIAVMEGMTTPLNVTLMPAQVLIVDDDAGGAFESYFEAAVAGAGRSYLTVSSPPTAAQMSAFETVVWFTGNDYTTTLTAADQAELAAYLNGGGRLFMTGQDIGYDIRTEAFYADYLHAAYVQDDVALGAVLGNPASPVGFGFSFAISGGSGASNQAYPSEINPVGGAMSAFFYDPNVPGAPVSVGEVTKNGGVVGDGIADSGTAGLTYENGYKLVYFAFGFEAIADASTRTELMDRVLDWLQGYPEINHTPLGDTEDTAHPYTVTATITSDFFTLDPSSFAVVYSANGGPDFTVAMIATGAPDEYAASIPAQASDTEVAYFIRAADVEGHASVDPLGAPLNRYSFYVGRDMVAPEIVHMPLRDTNDLTGPYPVMAEVTDNIGVESVYLLYSKNGGLWHRAKMIPPDPVSPVYLGEIPGPTMVGDQFDYFILAMDESYSGNVTREPATGSHSFSIVEEFVWDFEMDDGGLTQTGDVWQWGAPTSGPGMAHSGMNLWATILGANYPNSSNATLDLPAITIAADRPYAVFSFWHWYNMENTWDGGNVKVSTDGGATFQIVTPARGYDGVARSGNAGIPNEPCFTNIKEFWQEDVFDLSAFAGQQVILRLHFGSDGSVQRSGWYVDDMRLRSSDTDDVAPSFSNVVVPASTFDTAGPYVVSADVRDLFSGLASVDMYYSLDGGPFVQVPMTPGTGDQWSASIGGQAQGTRIRFYMEASDNAGNTTREPLGAPGDTHLFAILPSAPTLVLSSSTTLGAGLDGYRAALEANGYEADYWSFVSQGSEVLNHLSAYENIILEETSSMTSAEMTAYGAFLQSGTVGSKKGFFILARSVGLTSSNRPFIMQYLRSEYVQNDAGWKEITGEPGDPIGIGETFLLNGTSVDEIQRSTTYPGGLIVYRFTAPGTAAMSRAEYGETLEKYGEEWDGVVPDAPISLDAACGIRYNGDTYRSIYLTYDMSYVTELSRREGIMDRGLRWLASPEIVHSPLPDTEDTTSPYAVTALVYSDNLDPTRVRMTYDVGGGAVVVQMTPTANPDEWSASIPAQPLGTTVRYYLSAANLDGNTSYDPPTAPTDQHSFDVNADLTPPVIAHAPVGTTADITGPYVISADVTDNAGISSVQLSWRKNGGSTTTVAMTNTMGDTYEGSMPGPSVFGDLYEYFIVARDIAGVPNTARSPQNGFHSLEVVDFYAWDFEADDGGFSAIGQDWQWGSPTSGPGGAYSGVNLWATQLSANYTASSNSRLDSPPVVVPNGSTYAQMSLWMWYDTELNYDGMNVKVSTDGGSNWTILTPDIGYNATATSGNAGIAGERCFSGHGQKFWQKATFDMTPYKGQGVIVRLHFGSDGSVQYPGFYVDDVRIEGMEDTEGPAFVSRSIPLSTFDETGPYLVKATVVDALSGVAGVDMHYSTDGGTIYTTVAMTGTGSADEYGADIPGQSSGTRIKVYFSATDNASNGSTDPDGAPGTSTWEFGILPSGDYLVIVGGTAETTPLMFQEAFATLGRTYDIWDWDVSGVPDQSVLNAYQAIVVDESFYFDATQLAALTAFLNTDDGTRQQIFFMGRDLSFGSSARPFMEQYTGAAYVKDNPAWFQISSAPGDPIGAGETFTISGSYPDELKFSTTWTGAEAVYRYSGVGSASDRWDTEKENREFYEKEGKEWDPKLWPFAPSGPDSLAGVRFVGPSHSAVYFSFNLYYIQEPARRAAVLGRALDWLASTTTLTVAAGGETLGSPDAPTLLPQQLSLGQNYPNPFNPVTQMRIGIPAKHTTPVSLKIYNVRGQLVRTVFSGVKPAGYHTFKWDGTDEHGSPVATGVYFANFVADNTRLTRKMVLLK
ncbi:MAG: S8 family serine peptidase [Candidatus Krumholzibacteria bacterium]|nr:S8 family serine peptidase [Candidatus Krumholzibacteria bacterium]MDH4337495.1 S8 family serine peptidase [Candidatus Krumholzibacteria bacterium]MDH5268310.1 S8 family serine peptidase [Candidatus Krumholzibacteria bacterium]